MDEFIFKIDKKLNSNTGLKDCIDLVKAYKKDITNYCSKYIDDDYSLHLEYKRTIVYRDSQFEIILITWYPYSETKIHDHADKGCIMFLIDGLLTEKKNRILHNYNSVMNNSVIPNTEIVSIMDDNLHYIDNSEFVHQILNSSEISHSIHIYSPPGYTGRVYTKEKH